MDMVTETEAKLNGGEAEAPATELPPALAEKPAGLPPGKYALVGWDMDTTGRRLIDEVSTDELHFVLANMCTF